MTNPRLYENVVAGDLFTTLLAALEILQGMNTGGKTTPAPSQITPPPSQPSSSSTFGTGTPTPSPPLTNSSTSTSTPTSTPTSTTTSTTSSSSTISTTLRTVLSTTTYKTAEEEPSPYGPLSETAVIVLSTIAAAIFVGLVIFLIAFLVRRAIKKNRTVSEANHSRPLEF